VGSGVCSFIYYNRDMEKERGAHHGGDRFMGGYEEFMDIYFCLALKLVS